MCGINGIISLRGSPISDPKEKMKLMNGWLSHRGPDYAGVYNSPDNKVVLGNTRLSIVDPRNKFKVPLESKNYQNVLTFNGELYNYKELRSLLGEDKKLFRTDSDTEVMLYGLQKMGEKFLRLADGFWSFCYYEKEKNEILLSRDLLGEKSLYYYINSKKELIFSSEINPIINISEEPFSFDYEAVVCSFRYRATSPGNTLIKDLKKLKSGNVLKINLNSGKIIEKNVQKLDVVKYIDFFLKEPKEESIIDLYHTTLEKSCNDRRPSDVPFISTLSGGIDSTLVSFYLSDQGKNKINTLFGITNQKNQNHKAELGEIEASSFTSNKINSNHSFVDMFNEDVVDLYKKHATDSFDGVFCEGAISLQMLAKKTRNLGARVLLMSEGGDEGLCGYDVDKELIYNSKLVDKNFFKKKMLEFFYKNGLSKYLFHRNYHRQLINLFYFNDNPFKFRPSHGGTKPEVIRKIFNDDYNNVSFKGFGTISNLYSDVIEELDIAQKISLSYACSSLPEYFNTRNDRSTMKESVEVRLPLQSKEFMSLMIATPLKWKLKGGNSKYILRKLVEKKVSHKIAYRKKYGFAAPAWVNKSLTDKLKIENEINESKIFSDFPFAKGAKEFFLKPNEERHRWFAYCLIKMKDRLNKKNGL